MKIVRPYIITPAALLSSSIPEEDHPVYNPTGTYEVGDRVIIDHLRYESLQPGNMGHSPATSPEWWLPLGATNRWLMFDKKIGSQSTADDEISVQINVAGRADVVALLNVSAAAVEVTAEHETDGTIYSRTVPLVADSGITDWHSYFFEPIEREGSLILTDLPLYSGTTLTVTIAAPDSIAAVGALLVGQSKEVGGTQYGASLGIQDYSIKSRDDWGNATIVPRDYSSTGRFTIEVDNHLVDRLHRLLAGYRAEPILYLGTDIFSSTAIYGYFTDFNISISYFSFSICSIEIESLT